MRSIKDLTVVTGLLALALMWGDPTAAQSETRFYQTGELLVKYKTGNGPISKSANLQTGVARSARAIGSSRIHRVELQPGVTVEQALKIYAEDPNIEIAEPNYIIRPSALPNDPGFDKQWGLHNTGQMVSGTEGTTGVDMDAERAWEIITSGNKVIVAVLDTGCDLRHPDLENNIWSNSGEIEGDGIDNDGNGFIDDIHGWDFADEDNDPYDASGHGTHVAGIIAAEGNNQLGISGVAWKARIMSVRIMNGLDIGTTADAIDAIHYAVQNGAKIINCSWGGASYSKSLRHAIASANALFVCAAGNSGIDSDDQPYYPASYESKNIISVAASDQKDQLAWFSNYGTVTTDVAAPGTRIYSLSNSRRALWSDDFTDGNLDDWTFGGTNAEWDIGSAPGASSAGSLATSSKGDNVHQANTWAKLPPLKLRKTSAALLTFSVRGGKESNADRLYLEISTDGSHWTNIALSIGGTIRNNGISGSIPYWMTTVADLGRWDGASNIYLRLRYYSNTNSGGKGFWIDNMRLTVADDEGSYQTMQGTSMAAAFVSGLATLIKTKNRALTATDIKFIIENSVDLNQHFLPKIATGGRVNGYNALTLLRELSLRADMNSLDSIQLSWTTDTPLSGPIVIQRRMDGELNFSAIADVKSDTHAYEDSGVNADTTYYYRVQTQTTDGDHRYSHQTLAGGTAYSSLTDDSSHTGGGGGGGCFINSMSIAPK